MSDPFACPNCGYSTVFTLCANCGYDSAASAKVAPKPLVERIKEFQSAVDRWAYLAERSGQPVPIDGEVLKNLSTLLVEAADALKFHPRAAKLMGKKKPFVVVAYDEKYFVDVYKTIRVNEIDVGRWTAEDQKKFLIAIHLDDY